MLIEKLYRDFFYYSSMEKVRGVYMIYCKDTNIKDFYIGYTTDYRNRILAHKYNTYNIDSKKYNIKVYEFIRNNGGWDNWTSKLVEKDCDIHREKYYYELLEPTLNTYHCGMTMKEYRKKYYATPQGRKTILENFKKKVECDLCGKTMSKSSLCRHKKHSCPNRTLTKEINWKPIVVNFE